MENLTLREALNRMDKKKDKLQWKDQSPILINGNGTFVCTVTGISFHLNLKRVTEPNWQIIPAKKEIIGVEEAWKNAYTKSNELPTEYWNYFSNGFKISAENRDILYADLMEKLAAFFKTESGAAKHDLKLALEKVVLVLV